MIITHRDNFRYGNTYTCIVPPGHRVPVAAVIPWKCTSDIPGTSQ